MFERGQYGELTPADAFTTEGTGTGNGTVLEVSLEYAHGVYDGREREFRGFARVTQLDREAPATDPQPIAQARVVRWYHTGADLDLRNEWFPVPGDLIADEIPNHPWARRAVRGLAQREETYALDGQRRPYLVTETAYRAFAAGRSSASLHSAWAPLPVHSRSTVLERTSDVRQAEVVTTYDLHDGRTSGYGLPVEVREIGHGRRGTFSADHEQQQTKTLERFTRTTYVSLDQPEPDDPSAPYTPYYVVGKPSVQERFAVTGSGNVLLAKTRSFYDGNDYEGLGYPGSGTSLGVTKGLLSCRLDLAFTSTGFTAEYPSGSGAASARDARGHYLVDGNEHYVHAVRMAYTKNGLPSGSLDPNDNETRVEYDPTHDLFPVLVTEGAEGDGELDPPHSHPTVLEPGTVPFRLEHLSTRTTIAPNLRTIRPARPRPRQSWANRPRGIGREIRRPTPPKSTSTTRHHTHPDHHEDASGPQGSDI